MSPYTLDADGSLSPLLPIVCPLHATDPEGYACTIAISHRRDRETGPQFPLFVMVCKEHNIGFTLYPPGYYPYSRQTLAPVAHDGSLLVEQVDCNSFSGTIFDAALDAGGGILWDRESFDGSFSPRFTTQGRQIKRIAQLFGIGSKIEVRQREEVAQILMISGQHLHDCATEFIDIPSITFRGKKISTILKQIPITTTIFERLAEIGTGAGLWPAPLFCCPASHLLQPSPFQSFRTRGSP